MPQSQSPLLDPRFKNIHFQDVNACERAIQKLKVQQDIFNPNSESEVEESPKEDYDFWLYHKELIINQKPRKTNIKSDELSPLFLHFIIEIISARRMGGHESNVSNII